MKKTVLFLFFITISCVYTNAQLIELANTGDTNPGSFTSIVTYDNEIMYTIVNNSSEERSGSFVSNGTVGEEIELFPDDNIIFDFSKFNFFKTNIHSYGNYSAGSRIFAVGRKWTSTQSRIYEFNKARTSLLPNNIFGTGNVTPNIKLVGTNELLTVDTSGRFDRYLVFNNKNEVIDYTPENINGISKNAVNFFKYNNDLYFSFSGLEVFRMNKTSMTRITDNNVSSNSDTRPREFFIDDLIYFIGIHGFYTSLNPLKRENENAVCYANGAESFGSTETLVRNGDDGSTGYKAFPDTTTADEIIGNLAIILCIMMTLKIIFTLQILI